jgi:hypothetical protein
MAIRENAAVEIIPGLHSACGSQPASQCVVFSRNGNAQQPGESHKDPRNSVCREPLLTDIDGRNIRSAVKADLSHQSWPAMVSITFWETARSAAGGGMSRSRAAFTYSPP